MPFINWSEKMSVGEITIDRQHKTLTEMVNSLYEAMGRGKGENVLEPMIKELVQYTRTHFAYEEKFMQKIGFPTLPQHKLLHTQLTSKVEDIHAQIAGGKHFSAVTLGGFLKDWLTSHILNEDMKYSSYAKAGVS